MKIELKYFDFTGRGEVLRILLNGCKNVEFTDTRIPFSEWSTVKPTLPLGQIPILSIDGTVMTQSVSLYRYCAKLVDLYPSDPFQALVVDETMDVLNDMLAQLPKGSGTDEELKTKRHEFRDTIMKQSLTLVESRIEQYGADTNTICGVPSVADVFIMTFINALESNSFTHLDSTILKEYPRMVNVTNTATKLPIVVSYNKK
jgi:prostaglandin-H2 D-isomerase / glutathione transferase